MIARRCVASSSPLARLRLVPQIKGPGISRYFCSQRLDDKDGYLEKSPKGLVLFYRPREPERKPFKFPNLYDDQVKDRVLEYRDKLPDSFKIYYYTWCHYGYYFRWLQWKVLGICAKFFYGICHPLKFKRLAAWGTRRPYRYLPPLRIEIAEDESAVKFVFKTKDKKEMQVFLNRDQIEGGKKCQDNPLWIMYEIRDPHKIQDKRV